MPRPSNSNGPVTGRDPGQLPGHDRAETGAIAHRARAPRVLVVDSAIPNRVVVKGLLARMGIADVAMASDGEQALRAAAQAPFDLILMDCHMPAMDGFEATARLRAQDFGPPIIALMAHEAERDRSLAAGMNDGLVRPLDAREFTQTISRWVAGPQALQPELTPERVFDRERALKQLGGDAAILAGALAVFRRSVPAQLDDLSQALAEDRSADVRRHLHSLAGATAMIGARPLEVLARELEAFADAGQLAPVRRQWEALRRLVDLFVRQSAA